MEGAYVYNNNNYSVLVMYKEISIDSILFVIYSNYELKYAYISAKNFIKIKPSECIHILTVLPYIDNFIDLILEQIVTAGKSILLIL